MGRCLSSFYELLQCLNDLRFQFSISTSQPHQLWLLTCGGPPGGGLGVICLPTLPVPGVCFPGVEAWNRWRGTRGGDRRRRPQKLVMRGGASPPAGRAELGFFLLEERLSFCTALGMRKSVNEAEWKRWASQASQGCIHAVMHKQRLD